MDMASINRKEANTRKPRLEARILQKLIEIVENYWLNGMRCKSHWTLISSTAAEMTADMYFYEQELLVPRQTACLAAHRAGSTPP